MNRQCDNCGSIVDIMELCKVVDYRSGRRETKSYCKGCVERLQIPSYEDTVSNNNQ